MSKNLIDELDFIPEDNNRPLTDEEIRKIELKKLIKELRKKHVNQPIITTKAGEAKPASQLTPQEQADEILRCGLDPIYFIETYLTVFDQTQGDGGKIVPFKLFPFQKELILAYQKNKENIANKYRQAGVSTTTCAYITWYVMFNANRYVAVIADKLETARDELMSDIIDFIEGCPNYLRPSIALVGGKDSMHHKRYSNGSQMKAFAATKLRGPTPTLVFWDETAWTEKGEKFWESAGPAVRNTGGRVIFVSTPNGLDPIFYKTFEASRVKKSKGEKPQVNPIELWWYNDPRYTMNEKTKKIDLKWVKKTKEGETILNDTNFSKEQRSKLISEGYSPTSSWFEKAKEGYNGDMRRMAQEILCSFLGSGDNFISEEFIQRIEQDELRQPVATEYADKLMFIYEEPVVGALYIMALDVASGHGNDYSTLSMLKVRDSIEPKQYVEDGVTKTKQIKRRVSEQVAEYCGKLSPQQLAEMAYYYGKRYNDAYCVVDVSGGYGVSTIESLIAFGYKNIHYSEIQHKPTKDRLNVFIKTKDRDIGGKIVKVDLIPGFLISNNRPLVLQEMERSIRMQDVIIRSPRMVNEFKTFIIVENPVRLADHRRSFHDDLIMGLAIGLFVANFDMNRDSNSAERTRSMLNAILVVNDNDHIPKPEQKHREAEDWRVTKDNPYASNSWLFAGLDKPRR